MLVLLTIVLTTSTFIATGGIKVELPKAQATEQVSIPLSSLSAVLEGLDRETPLWVRADKDLAPQGLVDVFVVSKQLGFTPLSLQTEQRP